LPRSPLRHRQLLTTTNYIPFRQYYTAVKASQNCATRQNPTCVDRLFIRCTSTSSFRAPPSSAIISVPLEDKADEEQALRLPIPSSHQPLHMISKLPSETVSL
jgi:hypothetical protein